MLPPVAARFSAAGWRAKRGVAAFVSERSRIDCDDNHAPPRQTQGAGHWPAQVVLVGSLPSSRDLTAREYYRVVWLVRVRVVGAIRMPVPIQIALFKDTGIP